MKRFIFLASIAIAGCGTNAVKTAPPAPSCNVPVGHASMGACAPQSFRAGEKTVGPREAVHGIQIVDLSNNDPAYNMRPMARHGIKGMWLKVNEGTGYTDRTFSPMVHAARSAKIPVSGYDFVRNYSSSEAHLFVRRLRATGTCTGRNTLPPVLDIEAGTARRAKVQNMVNIVRHYCGRIAIYTGLWYWHPYLGNWWPRGVSAWISGYPNIVGRANYGRVDVHQFTDRGYNGSFYADLSVWRGSRAGYIHYINGKPAHRKHNKSAQSKHLHLLLRERVKIRQHLINSGCRVRRPRRACKPLFDRGAAVNKEIKYLHSRHIR